MRVWELGQGRGRGENQMFHSGYSTRWRNNKGKHTISLLRKLETYGTEHVTENVLSQELLTCRRATRVF